MVSYFTAYMVIRILINFVLILILQLIPISNNHNVQCISIIIIYHIMFFISMIDILRGVTLNLMISIFMTGVADHRWPFLCVLHSVYFSTFILDLLKFEIFYWFMWVTHGFWILIYFSNICWKIFFSLVGCSIIFLIISYAVEKRLNLLWHQLWFCFYLSLC